MSESTVSDVRKMILDIIVGIGCLQSIGMGSMAPELESFKQLLEKAKERFQQLWQSGSLCADEVQEFKKSFLDLEEEIYEFEHGCCVEA